MASSRRFSPALTLVALLTACGAPEDPPQPVCSGPEPALLPDVLLVTFDTLRADHCSSYGYPRRTTPTLDRVGRRGVLFEAAYAVAPTTGPSHATLFTSLYPDEHQVLSNRWELQGELLTLAEMLSAAGYRTGGFASSFMVAASAGMAQGFDTFDDDFDTGETVTRGRKFVQGERIEGDFDRRAADTAERALEWLAKQPGDQPVFLWLHSYQPHMPCRPSTQALRAVLGEEFDTLWRPGRPEPTEERRRQWKIARYDAEARYADDQVGRVLEALETRARGAGLLSVITSDHGEGLEDHGWPGHGIHLFEEAVRVPLVMSWPDRIPAARRVDAAVGLIDVVPTLLALLDIECPRAELRGQDLSLAWGSGGFAERPVFLQRRFFDPDEDKFDNKDVVVKGPKIAVRDGKWKLVLAPEEGPTQLFDLLADPGELRDVAAEHPEVLQRLEGQLRDWKGRQRPRVSATGELDDEDRAGLHELGYTYAE